MSARTLQARAKALNLVGLLDQWERWADAPWLQDLLEAEETVRTRRGVERRVKQARLGRFRPLADFDWSWPSKLDRDQVEELCGLEFVRKLQNLVLVGPNGVGKTMLAKNIAHRAALEGHTVLFTTASAMLNDLGSRDSSRTLQAAIRRYCQPSVLVVDELGYLSYSNRAADLLFEVVTGRYEQKPIVLTTNKPFAEWGEVFPNATCVVTLVDRLVHHAEIVSIEGRSYRLKEAQEAERSSVARRQARKASR